MHADYRLRHAHRPMRSMHSTVRDTHDWPMSLSHPPQPPQKIASSRHPFRGSNHQSPKDLRNVPTAPDLTAML